MIVKVSELKGGFSCVYKISYPNSRVYIGSTTDLRRRMWEHNNLNKNVSYNDEAIKEFGRVREVEILFESNDVGELESQEAHWISVYDSTNIEKGYNVVPFGNAYGRKGENHHGFKLTDEDVFDIRTRKMNGERRKNVFSDYKDKVSLKSGFDAVWNGLSRRDILPEVISHFDEMSKADKISFGCRGEKSGRAKVTENDVRYIRSLYDSGMKIREINNIYDNLSYRQVLRISKRETWKHVE